MKKPELHPIAVDHVKAESKTEILDIVNEKENIQIENVDCLKAQEVEATADTEEIAENEYDPKLISELPVEVEAFSSDRLNIVDIDVDGCNPLLVQVYIKEIYDYVFALEVKYFLTETHYAIKM